MKTSFQIFEYFKGVGFSLKPYTSSYTGIYRVPRTYKNNKIERNSSQCTPCLSFVPMRIYLLFKDHKEVETTLFTERCRPCAKYIDKVEWLS